MLQWLESLAIGLGIFEVVIVLRYFDYFYHQVIRNSLYFQSIPEQRSLESVDDCPLNHLTRYMLPNQKNSLILPHTLHLHSFIMITHTIDIEVFQISFYGIFHEVYLWELYMSKEVCKKKKR
ncbi:hypothetical protein Avbf_04845 [Armadillidium vulgare]|nr:hypothetical protein Avbf_04845 [Armadillidium vulgare]